jgi:double-stranded uracil-DNA glycosylase
LNHLLHYARAFQPIARSDAQVLILGSMPGIASLDAVQYYAHPRNAFWMICGELFGAGPELPYDQRLERLMDQRVALWDVYAGCERPGSLDSAIVDDTAELNDFATFLIEHPAIRTICCNGGKAHSSFQRHVWPNLGERAEGTKLYRLPSTSPANAGMSYADKLAAWQAVLDGSAGA